MKRLTHIFLIIQWLIFISYMTMDLYSRSMGFYSALLKYTGILLCCFYTWTLYTHSQIPSFYTAVPGRSHDLLYGSMSLPLRAKRRKISAWIHPFFRPLGISYLFYIQGPKTGCCIVICAVHDLYAHADHKHRHRHTQFCKISEY